MTTRLTLAIQEHFDQLSPSERRLAALLLERSDDMLTYSATELAAMAEVSKASANPVEAIWVACDFVYVPSA